MPEPTRRMMLTLLGALLVLVGMLYFWQATAAFRAGSSGESEALRGMIVGGLLLFGGAIVMFRATGRKPE